MDQDPLDLVMRGKGSPEDQLLEEIKEVKSDVIQCPPLNRIKMIVISVLFNCLMFRYIGTSNV